MTNEQVKRYYYRFCRWQLSGPHYVNCHQDSVQHCHNCGTEFADNFCPRCGQRAEVGRVGWNSLSYNENDPSKDIILMEPNLTLITSTRRNLKSLRFCIFLFAIAKNFFRRIVRGIRKNV